jgi:hypothetical protein
LAKNSFKEASLRVGNFGSGAGATGSTSSSLFATGTRSVEGSGDSAFAMIAGLGVIESCVKAGDGLYQRYDWDF